MAIIIVGDWAAVAQASIPVTQRVLGGWSDPLAEISVPLEPSEIIVGGWKQLAELSVPIEPSEIIVGGWKRVSQATLNLQTPIVCLTDDDCPEGYVCENGVCVPRAGGFPWGWLAVGGGALAAAVLIITSAKKKPTTKGKK